MIYLRIISFVNSKKQSYKRNLYLNMSDYWFLIQYKFLEKPSKLFFCEIDSFTIKLLMYRSASLVTFDQIFQEVRNFYFCETEKLLLGIWTTLVLVLETVEEKNWRRIRKKSQVVLFDQYHGYTCSADLQHRVRYKTRVSLRAKAGVNFTIILFSVFSYES